MVIHGGNFESYEQIYKMQEYVRSMQKLAAEKKNDAAVKRDKDSEAKDFAEIFESAKNSLTR